MSGLRWEIRNIKVHLGHPWDARGAVQVLYAHSWYLQVLRYPAPAETPDESQGVE